ncbi:MAG: hypothetical protein WCE79_13095 [Xanthobacteraceae bacterium]
MAPALRRTEVSSRRLGHLPHQAGAPHVGERLARITANPATSNATLVRRMTERLDRTFARNSGNRFAAIESSAAFGDHTGWNAVVAPPDSAARASLAAAIDMGEPQAHGAGDAASTSSDTASTVRSSGAAEATMRNWKRPIGAPESNLVLPAQDVARRATAAADSPRGNALPHITPSRMNVPADVRTANPPDMQAPRHAMSSQTPLPSETYSGLPASGAEQADVSRASFHPFARTAPERTSPRAVTEPGHDGVRRTAGWSASDRFEFTESLRLALIEDARRNGIDV